MKTFNRAALRPLLLSVAVLGALNACSKAEMAKAAEPEKIIAPAPAPSAETLPRSEIAKANFDTTTSACENFYQYANGGWLSKNAIPNDQTSWGSFNILAERGTNDLRVIAEDAQKNMADQNQKLVGAFYAAGMDEAAIEALGAKPLAPDMALIDSVKASTDISRYLITMAAKGQGVLFRFGSGGDFKNPDMQIGFAGQGGLGLPERDYYLRTDADSKKLIAQYQAHIAKMFALAGQSESAAKGIAERIFQFELRLAKASLARVAMRDPKNQYRLVDLKAANAETPQFSWTQYFAALGLKVDKFSLTSPAFFAEANKMMKDTSVATWREYFRWNALRSSAPYLSQAFVDENFDFYSRTLRGAKEMRPRWKRMVDTTSDYLGDPMGQLYVAKHFPPEAKAQALELITDLKSALKARLEKLDWMSAATKKEALGKFATFTPKIGYPDKWRDYSGLMLKPDDFAGNMERIAEFEFRFEINKIGKPTDRTEWGMSPQTVNAYYNPQVNEIVFPAAILQPPFFDPKADKALNYGGIGGVIGHELLHGFDDQGSKFDAKGANRDWWSSADRKNFEARTALLDRQASGTKINGMNINGKLTMGENIADLGGTTIAYDALQLALARAPQGAIDDLTQDQRFYVSWANIWRRNMREESIKLQINTDPHSPSLFRVNGPLSNTPAFHTAFGCKASDAMVNPNRVVIW
jgi:putative endopeptidase